MMVALNESLDKPDFWLAYLEAFSAVLIILIVFSDNENLLSLRFRRIKDFHIKNQRGSFSQDQDPLGSSYENHMIVALSWHQGKKFCFCHMSKRTKYFFTKLESNLCLSKRIHLVQF